MKSYMKTCTPEELAEIIERHRLWLDAVRKPILQFIIDAAPATPCGTQPEPAESKAAEVGADGSDAAD